MDSKTVRTLEDIRNAILEIKTFFGTRPMRYDVYLSDVCLRRAVERNISIIGEAMNRLHKFAPDIEFSSTHSILEICNSNYDKVTNDMMWGIVIGHLPLLKAEVEKMLK